MRESWERKAPWLNLNIDSLTELIQPVFNGCRVISAQPTQGGLANTNYRLELFKAMLKMVVYCQVSGAVLVSYWIC